MSSPLTEARRDIEASIAQSLDEWGKVISIREALNLTYPQQASLLGPRWAILEWKAAQPEAWGPGLEGQSQEVHLWLIDRGASPQGVAEAEDLVRARTETAFRSLTDALKDLGLPIDSFRLDVGAPNAPLRKLAESREHPHLFLFSCQASTVWQSTTQ